MALNLSLPANVLFTQLDARLTLAEGGTPTPTPTPSLGTPAYVTPNSAVGYDVVPIYDVPVGVTPSSITPNDGRFRVGGSEQAGWVIEVGTTALSAGTVNVSVNVGQTVLTVAIIISDVTDATFVTPDDFDPVPFGAIVPQQVRMDRPGSIGITGAGASYINLTPSTGVWYVKPDTPQGTNIAFSFTGTPADGSAAPPPQNITITVGAALPAAATSGLSVVDELNAADGTLLENMPNFSVRHFNGVTTASNSAVKISNNRAVPNGTDRYPDKTYAGRDIPNLSSPTDTMVTFECQDISVSTFEQYYFVVGATANTGFLVAIYPDYESGFVAAVKYYDGTDVTELIGNNKSPLFVDANGANSPPAGAPFSVSFVFSSSSMTIVGTKAGINKSLATTFSLAGRTVGTGYGLAGMDPGKSVERITASKPGTGTLTVLDAPIWTNTNTAKISLAYSGTTTKPQYIRHRPAGTNQPWRVCPAQVTGDNNSGRITYHASELVGGDQALQIQLLSDTSASTTTEAIRFLDPVKKPLIPAQNVSHIYGGLGVRRVFTNLLIASYIQGDNATVPQDVYPVRGDQYLSAEGWPKQGGIVYQHVLPSTDGDHTLRLKWTGGAMTFRWGIGNGPVEGGWTIKEDWHQVSANLWESTITIDRAGSPGNVFGNLNILTVTAGNLPTDLFLYEAGDDLTQRIHPSFVDFAKKLPNGWLRYMDSTGANFGGTLHNKLDWTKRTHRNHIALGTGTTTSPSEPYWEDFIEIANLAGRSAYLALPAALFYGANSLNYFDQLCDLIYNGTGAEGAAAANGATKRVVLELYNEGWNSGLGSYRYLGRMAMENGRYTPTSGDGSYDTANGNDQAQASFVERNYLQKFVFSRLLGRISTAAARTTKLLGTQTSTGDYNNLKGQPNWTDASAYIDIVMQAPYVPPDPAATPTTVQPNSHSPADVVLWIQQALPAIRANVDAAFRLVRADGFGFGMYEFNVSLAAIQNLSRAESLAIRSSAVFNDCIVYDLIPFVSRYGGQCCAYSDTGSVANAQGGVTPQQWAFEVVPGSTLYNKLWDRWTELGQAQAMAA